MNSTIQEGDENLLQKRNTVTSNQSCHVKFTGVKRTTFEKKWSRIIKSHKRETLKQNTSASNLCLSTELD